MVRPHELTSDNHELFYRVKAMIDSTSPSMKIDDIATVLEISPEDLMRFIFGYKDRRRVPSGDFAKPYLRPDGAPIGPTRRQAATGAPYTGDAAARRRAAWRKATEGARQTREALAAETVEHAQ